MEDVVPVSRWANSCGYSGLLLCSIMKEELPRYRSLTAVSVGDGATTSSWFDHWLLNTTLKDTFPVLFSHCVRVDETVRTVLNLGLDSMLQPRRTRAATEELMILSVCLAHVSLQNKPDARTLLTTKREPFTSSGAYSALQGLTLSSDVSRIWATKLPTKIKFFAWLLFHGRLNTRAHLHHRNIKPLQDSWCERCPGVLETDAHIFWECSAARGVWDQLHISILGDVFRRPWELVLTHDLPKVVHVDILYIILWHIWKARNASIFDQQALSSSEVLRKVLYDI